MRTRDSAGWTRCWSAPKSRPFAPTTAWEARASGLPSFEWLLTLPHLMGKSWPKARDGAAGPRLFGRLDSSPFVGRWLTLPHLMGKSWPKARDGAAGGAYDLRPSN